MNILIVDDDEVMLRLLTHDIKEFGFSIATANNGEQALNILKNDTFDIIVSDILMPEIEGVTLCRKIRRDPQLEYLYIIIITTLNEEENIVQALNAGANDYITKPYIKRILEAKIKSGARLISLQNRLRQAEKMEVVGRLAGGIAHDFNNRLAAIMGYSELLSEKLAGNLELSEYSTKILHCVRRSADMVRQLLAFARKGKYTAVAVDLHAIIDTVYDLLSHSLSKDIVLKRQFNAHNSVITGDSTQLESVFLNLAINARDAMPNGGILTVTTENIKITDYDRKKYSCSLKTGKYIKISVIDTGTGIEPKVKKHLFEPFFTTKTKDKGTGMGLAAVYGTVKSHKGSIDVISEKGKGATFTLLLPVADVLIKKPEMDIPFIQYPSLATSNILIVDDEEFVRDMTSDLLSSDGYLVSTCQDGEAAVKCFNEKKGMFDLIILDMIMPKMDGYKTFNALREINPSLPIILSSGYCKKKDIDTLLKKGSTAFLQKPFAVKDLKQKVIEMLKK